MSSYTVTFDNPRSVALVNKPFRQFSSVMAFDGYVKELRALGCVCTFVTPYSVRAVLPA